MTHAPYDTRTMPMRTWPMVPVSAAPTTRPAVAPESSGLSHAVELAHDVRSPLSAMITMAEVLHSGACGPVNPAQKYQLRLLLEAAKEMSRYTADVIESFRSCDGNEPPAAFDVREVLNAVRQVVQPMVQQSGVQLIVRNHAPNTWLGRRTAVTRVLLNLTTNALKYTRCGVVEYGARLLSATRLEFFVRDTGGGMRPFVERPSDRTDSERWRRVSSGLGLAMSRKLLHSMGSTLDVESRPGDGCRFSFELALRDSA